MKRENQTSLLRKGMFLIFALFCWQSASALTTIYQDHGQISQWGSCAGNVAALEDIAANCSGGDHCSVNVSECSYGLIQVTNDAWPDTMYIWVYAINNIGDGGHSCSVAADGSSYQCVNYRPGSGRMKNFLHTPSSLYDLLDRATLFQNPLLLAKPRLARSYS
jgi:hypothetical protein